MLNSTFDFILFSLHRSTLEITRHRSTVGKKTIPLLLRLHRRRFATVRMGKSSELPFTWHPVVTHSHIKCVL